VIDPGEHPMVLGAMARMAGQGSWARLLEGKPLEDPLDLNDARLLVAAGVLRRRDDDVLEPVHMHPWHHDPDSLAGGALSHLRRALRHAEGYGAGWTADDLDIVRAQGQGSVAAAVALGEGLLPQMRAAHQAFLDGRARFLDVGVGIGAVAGRLCRMFPGTTAVGLDVLEPVLALAEHELREAGLDQRVELRLQSVAALQDVECFDLAWLPQPFIARSDLVAGVGSTFRALRPDRWLVVPLAASPSGADDFERALVEHGAHLTGGGAVTVCELTGLLVAAGFVDVTDLETPGGMVVLARRP
jgi:Methyltransferase domain